MPMSSPMVHIYVLCCMYVYVSMKFLINNKCDHIFLSPSIHCTISIVSIIDADDAIRAMDGWTD